MKKPNLIIVVAIALVCLFGCINPENTDREPVNEVDDFQLSQTEIIDLATYYISLFEGESILTRTNLMDYNFKTKYYDDNGLEHNPHTRSVSSKEVFPITELSINDQGKESSMFLCTDKRYPGLIAYIPNSDQEERNASDNLYFNSALQSFLVERQLIAEKTNTRVAYNPEDWPVGQVWGGVYPVLYTNWAHGSPYNLFKDTNTAGQRYNLSSATVAIVQILAYLDIQLIGYLFPSDWPYLYENTQITESDNIIKQQFISDMMITVENHLDNGLRRYDGSIYVDQAVWRTFFNDLFHSQNYGDLRRGYNSVLKSLDLFRVVHAFGESGDEIVDCAVIDGYLKVKNQYPQGYEIYWHINPAYTNGTGYYFFSTTSSSGDYYVYDPTRYMHIWNIAILTDIRANKGILVPPEHA